MIQVVEGCNIKNCIAVIPSVCVGNVGQLACDLLISSLNLTRLGYVWHRDMLTFCGGEPFDLKYNVATACEIFFSEQLQLIVFQIRSALKKNNENFLNDLCIWLKENEVKQVIILTGISAHRRRDQQLIGEPLRYIFCPTTKEQQTGNVVLRNWVELEIQTSKKDNLLTNFPSYISGSGIALKWYHKCVEANIPCSILLEFCSDGNNIPDALKLADYLDEWLQLKFRQQIDTWIIPLSWNLLFGSQPPAEIFN